MCWRFWLIINNYSQKNTNSNCPEHYTHKPRCNLRHATAHKADN
jgi:hypothetical protein